LQIQALHPKIRFMTERLGTRTHAAWLALLISLAPSIGWSESPPPNNSGHAHTCQKYFPKEASEQGAEGTTTLAFRITTDGLTRDVRVEDSSGNTELDKAAVLCAQQWHYLAAKMNGTPIEVSWKANVVWVLTERPLDTPDGSERPCVQQYPKEAASPGVHGTTKLTIQVATDGSVNDASVVDSSGSKELDDLAIVCVKRWRLSAEPEKSTKTAYVSWTIPYYGRK
jgi:TonB family protein